MNMPCLSKTANYQHVEIILDALEFEALEDMRAAGQRLREHILESGEQNTDTVVDAAVTFDGTWAKRGFTSLPGVVFVLSVDNGEVLDYHVLSKSCQRCALKKKTVVKLDCVGHVQKRMGKHLLNLKAQTKGKLADGKSIGGCGRLSGKKSSKFKDIMV